MTPNTDIVIGVRNCADVLPACLQALDQNTKNFRVIFNLDATGSAEREVVRVYCHQNPYSTLAIETFYQHWFTRSYNNGLRMVRTPCAVILNSDTRVGPNWLDELYYLKNTLEAEHKKTVGVVGSVWSPQDGRRYVITQKPDFVTGHACLFDMRVLDLIARDRGTPGWYIDESIVENAHIRSDVEWSYHMNGMGFLTVVSHYSEVWHKFGHSWGLNLNSLPTNLDQINPRWKQ